MKIKQLLVNTPQGESGTLDKDSRFVFNYKTGERSREVSLTMPIRSESYASGALLTPFAMNKPEGWLYQQIIGRMAKHEHIDDMRLLAITGSNQIGRLSFAQPGVSHAPPRAQIGLKELLKQAPSKQLFDFLVDVYFESGISGVQPKVMLPDADKPQGSRTTSLQPDLIVKSGGSEYPHLAENEFLCMDAARRADIRVPNFWLSEHGGLFVMQRFDLQADQRLGFEDMSVLMDKAPDSNGHFKYQGSYENILKIIRAYCRGGEGLSSSQRFFEYLALCVMLRNGDAHLKNFGLLYEHPSDTTSPTLAPIYDVVTTTIYSYRDYRSERSLVDRTLALKINKSNRYPSRLELLKFGADLCHVRNPEQVIERIANAMSETLIANRDRIDASFLNQIEREWNAGRLAVTQTPKTAP